MEQTSIEQERILKRLKRIEGQVRGIQRMIAEHRDCASVVTQLLAVRAALDKVGLNIMAHHIQECLRKGSTEEFEQLERVISFFLQVATLDTGQDEILLEEERRNVEEGKFSVEG